MLKSFEIPLCVQEVGQGYEVWMQMVEGESSHRKVLVRVPSTYVRPWLMLQRRYV